MDVNPISFQSIEAFACLNNVQLHHWEVITLERLDVAIMNVWHSGRPKQRQETTRTNPDPIPSTNVKGIRGLMRGLKARQAAKLTKGG